MGTERKTIPARTRAALQREIDCRCPFCQSDEVEQFQVHHIDGDATNDVLANLFMVCPTCHSKITKGDISPTEVLGVKTTLAKFDRVRGRAAASSTVVIKGNVTQAVVGNNNRVTLNTGRKPKPKYPAGCIGSETVKANYVSYLITRYHDFKAWEVGPEKMRYGLFPAKLKKAFGMGAARTIYNVPSSRFGELVEYIQKHVSRTALAKINTAKGQPRHFQTFDEYRAERGECEP